MAYFQRADAAHCLGGHKRAALSVPALVTLPKRENVPALESTLPLFLSEAKISLVPEPLSSSVAVLEHHPTARGYPSDKDARQNKELGRFPNDCTDPTRSENALVNRFADERATAMVLLELLVSITYVFRLA